MSDYTTKNWDVPEDLLHRPSIDPNPYGPDIGWRKLGVPGPGVAYVEVDDVLLFEGWNLLAAAAVNVSIRLLRADGVIVPLAFTVTIAQSSVTATKQTITVPAGFIISATIDAPTVVHGQIFVRISIQRGTGTSDITRGQVLLSGKPSQFSTLGYPQSPAQPALTDNGLVVFQSVANPAAGADWSFTVPAGQNVIVRSVRAFLTTVVAAGARVPQLQFVSGGLVAAQIPVPGIINNSQFASITWAHGCAAVSTSGQTLTESTGAPNARLNAGMVINVVTQNINAADQWSAIVLELEVFFGN